MIATRTPIFFFFFGAKSSIHVTFKATMGKGTPNFCCNMRVVIGGVSVLIRGQGVEFIREIASLIDDKKRVQPLLIKGKFISPFPLR